jgi:hypothetical protein
LIAFDLSSDEVEDEESVENKYSLSRFLVISNNSDLLN